jgi:6,7-dimethyl-8-ribityllumazine synthase
VIRLVEGDERAEGLHVGIAVASWNRSITDRLLEGALERCEELGVSRVTVARVPGALELPVTARALIQSGCGAVVAIGTVIKGETDHYEIVVRESSAGLTRVSVDTGVPVANAILAVHELSHALDRAGTGESNKGREGVEAAIMTANTLAGLAE